MVAKATGSTVELLKRFPDEEAARNYLEGRLWKNGPQCPTCSSTGRVTARKNGFYRCNACRFDFTVRTGTIFGRSHVPLHKWLHAMYLVAASHKGIGSLQLSRDIGITRKSAGFVLQRLREACGNAPTMPSGLVEVDETDIGSTGTKRQGYKRPIAGRGSAGKLATAGMRERAGRVRVRRG